MPLYQQIQEQLYFAHAAVDHAEVMVARASSEQTRSLFALTLAGRVALAMQLHVRIDQMALNN